MTRSEWICNDCGDGFETKGKRDSHRERRHRQKTLIGIEKQRAERSENGKFVCRCGRDYIFASSLRHHQRNCKDEILSREKVGNDKDIEQGIR